MGSLNQARLETSIANRLADLRVRRDALRHAMGAFGDDFQLDEFVTAFESTDPARVNLVDPVEANFVKLANYTVELARNGLVLTGELPADRRRSFREDLSALRDTGGLSAERCARLILIVEIRNQVQHEYVDISGKTLHDGVLQILDELPAFVRDYVRWLERHGHSLLVY